MSKSVINQFYVPMYRDLLSVPDYMKHFQTKSIGGMYTLLKSRIWRRGYSWTKSEGYFGPLLKCAIEYDNGNLCVAIADTELAEILGVTTRSVRRLRNQLVDLGLAEVAKEEYKSDFYFYRIGKVLAPNEYGNSNEVLFEERWLKEIEDHRDLYGEVVFSELDFVQKLHEILNGKNNKNKNFSAIVDMDVRISGHGCPESEIFDQGEIASTTSKIGDEKYLYKDKNIKGSINRSTEESKMQNSLFETEVDLSYIDENISVAELGRAITREANRAGKSKLKKHLRQVAKDLDLYIDPQRSRPLFLSTFVDAFFKHRPPSGKLSTAMHVWWKALAIDLDRPDLVADPKRVMIVLSRLNSINNWHEFSYLVKELFNENGGYRFFAEFKHVVWLTKAIQQNVYKLQDFRNTVDVTKLKNAKKINVDEVQAEIDARLAAMKKKIESEESKTNINDSELDDLLSWN